MTDIVTTEYKGFSIVADPSFPDNMVKVTDSVTNGAHFVEMYAENVEQAKEFIDKLRVAEAHIKKEIGNP